MKKLIALAIAVAIAAPLFAQDAAKADDSKAAQSHSKRRVSDQWPVFFAICDYPDSPDVIGFRLTFPFSTRQENVTGIDIGLWGRSLYFEGIQINILRNDVKDSASAFQVGLYNSAGEADLFCIQAGLWNEANTFRGIQAGLVNTAGEARGLQVGLINRSETMYGYQVGLINIIRDAELQFLPIVNVGF